MDRTATIWHKILSFTFIRLIVLGRYNIESHARTYIGTLAVFIKYKFKKLKICGGNIY